jgi:hypothetical protein
MADLVGPAIPQTLGWLNYWSAATVEWLGFPDASLDTEWLSRAQQLKNGAWLVSLTEEPLDLERAEHFDTLARAYARFPAVGRPIRG